MAYNVVPSLPKRRVLLAGGFFFLFSLMAIACAFLQAGNFLVREDPPEKATAVVVLSGGLPDRALGAAAIFRAGFAREVWLTQPVQPGAAMEELKLPYAGEQEYSRMVLIARGVPAADIRILRDKINNTEDELRDVAHEMDSHPGSIVIVVTSKVHTRRVRSLWKRVGNPRGRIVVRATSDDYFDSEHWWRSTNDALEVVREYLGLLNVWAGLPLHHSS
jgi:uncharacterized SAM-binding protein YcdF (DUF218 family)